MEKAILIQGPPASGKTTRALQIANERSKPENQAWLYGGQLQNFQRFKIFPYIEVLVIEEITSVDQLTWWMRAVDIGIATVTGGERTHPKLIFTSQEALPIRDLTIWLNPDSLEIIDLFLKPKING